MSYLQTVPLLGETWAHRNQRLIHCSECGVRFVEINRVTAEMAIQREAPRHQHE